MNLSLDHRPGAIPTAIRVAVPLITYGLLPWRTYPLLWRPRSTGGVCKRSWLTEKAHLVETGIRWVQVELFIPEKGSVSISAAEVSPTSRTRVSLRDGYYIYQMVFQTTRCIGAIDEGCCFSIQLPLMRSSRHDRFDGWWNQGCVQNKTVSVKACMQMLTSTGCWCWRSQRRSEVTSEPRPLPSLPHTHTCWARLFTAVKPSPSSTKQS